MPTEIAVPTGVSRPGNFVATAATRRRDHRFYTGMALALTTGVFAGFFKTYYGSAYFHSPALPFWLHVHGAVFTAWMLFYVLQNFLAMNGSMALHRNLGIVGVILAAGVFFFGLATTFHQASEGRFLPFPDTYSAVAVSTGQMILFAGFMTTGLLLRRDAETHKRFMLMAPQLVFFPAFGRLLGGVTPVTLLLALCFYLAGPVYDRITRGSVHQAYKRGVPLLILTMPPFAVIASHLPPWRFLVDSLLRLI